MTDRRDLRVTSPPRPPPSHWHLSLSGNKEGIDVVLMIIRSYFDHLAIIENHLAPEEVDICVPWYDQVFMPSVLETIEVELLRKGYSKDGLTIEQREVTECQMRFI